MYCTRILGLSRFATIAAIGLTMITKEGTAEDVAPLRSSPPGSAAQPGA